MRSLSPFRHLVVAVLAAASILAGSAVVAPSAGAEPSSAEQQAAKLVNDYRARNGRPPLQLDAGMSADARAWAGHMAAGGLAHDPNYSRSCDRYAPYTHCSENVGYSTGGISSVQGSFEGSSGHRASLLCSCTHIGLGVVESGGRTFVVQRFVGAGQVTTAAATPAAPVQYSQTQIEDAARFVKAAFGDFVGRSPSAADLDHWTERALTPAQRATLVHALAYSGEAIGAIIDGHYRDALGRAPEPAGRQHWIDRVRHGLPAGDLAVSLFSSTEHFQTVRGDLGRWVDDVYAEFLGRRPDAAGRSHWVAAARIFGRPAVAQVLHDSTESLRRRIDLAYRHLLGRAADPVGLVHWTAVLRSTRNDVQLAEALATSVEYQRRAVARH